MSLGKFWKHKLNLADILSRIEFPESNDDDTNKIHKRYKKLQSIQADALIKLYASSRYNDNNCDNNNNNITGTNNNNLMPDNAQLYVLQSGYSTEASDYDLSDFESSYNTDKINSNNNSNSNNKYKNIKQNAEVIYIEEPLSNEQTNKSINSLYSNLSNGINIGKPRELNPNRNKRKVLWEISKIDGNIENILKIKFTLNYHHELTKKLMKKNNKFNLNLFKKLISPISMKFQIDNYNVSGLDIRSLRCIDWTSNQNDGNTQYNGIYTTYKPYRWIRKITKSGSYICKI